jgi:hypothetical protein
LRLLNGEFPEITGGFLGFFDIPGLCGGANSLDLLVHSGPIHVGLGGLREGGREQECDWRELHRNG